MGASNPNARACSDLLSREAFPLHTLNNHPIAPVLLRMLQLNSCTSRSGSGGSTAVDASSQGDRQSWHAIVHAYPLLGGTPFACLT